METMGDVIRQEIIEECFSRKHIDKKIKTEIIANPDMVSKIQKGTDLVSAYIAGDYYASKMHRVKQLEDIDVSALVLDIFIGVAYCQTPELFTSVTSQMSARLGFTDQLEAICTVAELMAVLCATDAFDITKQDKLASLVIVSRIPVSDELLKFINNSSFLPPMVCEPLELIHNYSSGYLTHNDSLILGNGNHHDGDICLDVLNTINKVALCLDTQFVGTVEELPTFELDTVEKKEQWANFKAESYEFYTLMATHGNNFYFNHKVDKRGRIYSSGYHLNYQGTSQKKAMLEFAKQELIDGVPT